jgi:hypothetical protein
MRDSPDFIVDRSIAMQAVRLSMPTMEAAMDSREAGASGFLYVVVMRPGVAPGALAFGDAILYEHAVGDPAGWDADYGAFARAKAELSWRTGLDSHVAQQLKPHLLAHGDSLLPGGIVFEGIVVAVSGADPWYDEAFAGAIALLVRALARKQLARFAGKAHLEREEPREEHLPGSAAFPE